MNKLFKLTAIAAAMGACFSAPAFADSASSTGGLKIKSDDGRFEAALGGRIHLDANITDEDNTKDADTDGLFMRRAYITLAGKVYDFKYKLEYDLATLGNASAAGAANSGSGAAKEVWIGHDLLGGFIKAGHFQQAYGMEELTSSNEVLFMERPFISNNAIYNGREYQNGIGYNRAFGNLATMYVSAYDAGTAADANSSAAQEGDGYAGRVTFAPINTDEAVLHAGVSYDFAHFNNSAAGVGSGGAVNPRFVSRNGPTTKLTAPAAFVTGGSPADFVAGGYNNQATVDAELAGKFGPFFAQAEFARATYGQDRAVDAQHVNSYYVQASYLITGESKVYKFANGVFGNPKPNVANEWGAWEVKARYDHIANEDTPNGSARAETLSEQVFGVNWYPNSNVRFMLEYAMGEMDRATGHDNSKPTAITARAQVSF